MVFKKVLVKFGASWCNPCNQAQKFLDGQHPNGLHTSLDITENEELAKSLGVRSLPTFCLYDSEGVLIDKFVGFDKERINKAINTIL